MTRWGLFLALALCSAPVRTGEAQAADCTYDRCALRIQSKLFSTRVTAGREYISIARLGMFPPTIPALEQAGDSVRVHYRAFRSKQKTGAGLELTGLALLIVGVLAGEASGADVGGPLLLGGLGFGIAGGIVQTRGIDHLSQAIWWYNRNLSR